MSRALGRTRVLLNTLALNVFEAYWLKADRASLSLPMSTNVFLPWITEKSEIYIAACHCCSRFAEGKQFLVAFEWQEEDAIFHLDVGALQILKLYKNPVKLMVLPLF